MPPRASGPASLLSLPDAILDLIFAHVAPPGAIVNVVGVCRRLRPFAERHMYRSPCDTLHMAFDGDSLEAFNWTLRQRSELRKLVLRMRLNPVLAVGHERRQPGYLDKEGVPELSHLLLRLPNVTHVAIEDFDEESVGELLYTLSCMPCVSNINPVTPNDAHRWSEQLWSHLADISALASLSIQGGDRPLCLPRVGGAIRGSQSLRKLDLFASVSADSDASLAALAPNLRELRLRYYDDDEADADLKRILATAPPSVDRLYLDATPAKHFLLLSGLHELSLGSWCDIADAVADLAQSRVEVLVLNALSFPPEDAILSLLKGPHRMRHLRRLILDFPRQRKQDRSVNAMRAKLAASICSVHDAKVARHLLAQLCTRWHRGVCDAAGVERVLEAASEVGVEVSGEALGCLEWDRFVKREFRAALVDRIADAKTLFVQFLDNDEDAAAAEIRQRRPELVAWFSARGESA